ncbi:hypothetical protein GALL_71420 [mine drainage metagenome]|uniref:Bacteriophage phiJL001 Gp84 C-terminal domain-containing protein n=1 Tax=mine drainage metagenome TaxID=410659 RepID=A0A1J5SSK6_9ZZZZ
MKSASSALIAYLGSNSQLVFADLYTFTLSAGANVSGGAFNGSGVVVRYADFDADVVYNGNTFKHGDLVLTRDKVGCKMGLTVDQIKITAAPLASSVINGVPFLKAATMGMLDGARLQLDRVFFQSGAVVGGYLNFSGIVGDVNATRSSAEITVNSDIFLLNINMPRNLYMPTCQHTLFDADCALVKSAFANAGTAQAGSSATQVVCAGMNSSQAYFDAGTITFTGGAYNGVSRTVRNYSGGAFQLLLPLPGAPAVGDTFNAYPGCAKTSGVCTNKFNNVANFKGFELIPLPETLL